MYRYREATGSTQHALRALKHLPKLGRIYAVQGYQYAARHKRSDGTWYVRVDHRIKVFGDTGVAMFCGFCYGYSGEGPRGLIDLFKAIGVPTDCGSVGHKAAYEIKRSDTEVKLNKPVVDWTLEYKSEGQPVPPTWQLV